VGCDKQVHKGYVEVMAVDNLEIKNVGGGEKKGKKKREGGEIQRQQRECGRKIGNKGILGVVKYKRK
jgi:hypothetical protein